MLTKSVIKRAMRLPQLSLISKRMPPTLQAWRALLFFAALLGVSLPVTAGQEEAAGVNSTTTTSTGPSWVTVSEVPEVKRRCKLTSA